ncbi:MAG TPA: 50S ribosomal protein L9 [Clostridiaceae bacterium]|jgi:large subunit ribosomal protein L9|nr:50S ribosomal protein L9 [Clostridiaceae bacterium]
MKVLLLEGVKGLGQAGDVVDVKPGYANNFLLKRKLAVPATKDNMNAVEMKRRAKIEEEKTRLARAREIAKAVDGQRFVWTAKTGSAGRLYGTVTNQNIADMLSQHGYKVDKRDIMVSEPIKTVGSHRVTLRLHQDISVDFMLDVKADL